MKPRILLGTANVGKVEELRHLLADTWDVVTPRDLELSAPPPDEDGATFEANAALKAEYYCLLTGLPTLADDSGLCVDALGGAPGVWTARYGATPADRVARLLYQLDGVPDERRTARMVCVLALRVPGNLKPYLSRAELKGEIRTFPSGRFGFEFDRIFALHDAPHWRLADYPPMSRPLVSPRAKALRGLSTWLAVVYLGQRLAHALRAAPFFLWPGGKR